MLSSRKFIVALAIGAAVVAAMIQFHQPLPVTESATPTLTVAQTNLVLRDGRWWERGQTNPFTGLMVSFYPDGSLCSRSTVVRGLLHGCSEGWHTNGVVQVREQFCKGVSHGPRIKWHANGAKQSAARIVRGQIDGRFQRWDENGALVEMIEMKQGKPSGFSQAYFPDGTLKAEAFLRNGELIEQKYWQDGRWKVVSLH